jgi:murein DD-endopeptidase MepM/ murein hydrolase activator NlpD
MVAETLRWGSKLFPRIQICIGTRGSAEVPRRAQAALLVALLALAGALAGLGISRAGYKRLAADRTAAIIRAESANADLQDELAGLSDDRDRAQSRAATLAVQADHLRGLLDTTQSKLQLLDQARAALRRERAHSAKLAARLGKTEADRAAQAAQFAHYQAGLVETANQLQEIEASRGAISVRRARLRDQLGELRQQLSQAPIPQAGTHTAAQTSQAPTAPPPSGEARSIADFGRNEVAVFEQVLASAGVDVQRIFSQFGAAPAEGGPFVPPPKAGHGFETVDPTKLEAVRGLARLLPLGAPLVQYRVGSPFGPRIDPFNHRAAFHTGIDLDAPYSSPVYATGPGTVVHAGWLGEYGKVVEIDHGYGIETLYAHLQRCLVSVGEKVAAHTEIGLVGTTGRSTGPHVHYEVRVNDQPQDPEKFIELSRLIPQTEGQIIPAATQTTPEQFTPAAGAPTENSR